MARSGLVLVVVAAFALPAMATVPRPNAFRALAPGEVRPEAWLRTQLELARDGLTGHAEEIYDDIGQSDWVTGGKKGGQYAWERGPYYAKGLISLAYVLDDPQLKAKSQRWVEKLLASQREDGDFGPRSRNWWANMIVLHYMRDAYLATRDARILKFLGRYFAFQLTELPRHPLLQDSTWAKDRGGDNLEIALWYYDQTQDPVAAKLADVLKEQTSEWSQYYADGTGDVEYAIHIVNTMQGLKTPPELWRLTGSPKDREGYYRAISSEGWLMRQFGRADGMVNGTEPMTSLSTTEGTELCAIAERILSAGTALEILGDAALGDDLEYIAYNALPATLAPDGRGCRYYLLQNEPKCTDERLGYMCNAQKGDKSITPGPHPGFGCCRSNFHFAWPKFVQHLWMATPDGGVAATAYGPCTLTTAVAGGKVTLAETGTYPFGDEVRVAVKSAPGGKFPILMRVPAWSKGATLQVNGETVAAKPGTFVRLERAWKAGDVIQLATPAEVVQLHGNNDSLALRRGALLYALQLPEKRREIAKTPQGFSTWELFPTAPWNWALALGADHAPAAKFTPPASAADIPAQPFVWNQAPAKLQVKGFLTSVGRWGLYRTDWPARAYEPPASPVAPGNHLEDVTLVPFGSTQIRITLFPWTVMAAPPKSAGDYPVTPMGLTDVKFTEGFWFDRTEINRTATLRANMSKCEETPRIRNFENAGKALRGEAHDKFGGIFFDDSDVYKVVEGAAYTLAAHPDPQLDREIDRWISLFAGAQESDGYLYCARTLKHNDPTIGPTRWSNLASNHELYNLGHLFEAAAAHYQCTGKRNLLDVATKAADLLVRTFGYGADQRRDVPGHEEIEIGLCKLYRVTGKAEYLDLARKFLEWRGIDYRNRSRGGDYNQDHKPAALQREAVGHAVRAAYLYCGMADVAALTGDSEFDAAINALWNNIVRHKLHLNGGIGARPGGEAFGANDELPNESAYLETCAAIGNALFNERLFLAQADAKYIDVLERVIYNGFLSGISLTGDEFFYPNPLASRGGYRRSKWFGCSCCPVNIVRFVPQIAGWTYATQGSTLFWNLYASTEATAKVGGTQVALTQRTEYPWKGEAELTVKPEKPAAFALKVRIPGWAVGRPVPSELYTYEHPNGMAGIEVAVNGKKVALALQKGYCTIDRIWQAGDKVTVKLPMPVNRVVASPAVQDDRGRSAVERGPIMWCAEQVDNAGPVRKHILPLGTTFGEGKVEVAGHTFPTLVAPGAKPFTLIPYFAWAHRADGDMQVWFPLDKTAALGNSQGWDVTCSHCNSSDTTDALLDGKLPQSSNDDSIPRFTFWDRKGSTEWIEFSLPEPMTVKGFEVYWFDDTPGGGCGLPESWRVLAGNDPKQLKRVEGAYEVKKDAFSRGTFKEPVTGVTFRFEVKLRPNLSGGVLEIRPIK